MFAEIVDDLIDYLHNDTTTLRSLTLVQKQWLPRSSFHLFSRLRWPPCKHQWPEEPTNPDEPCKCHMLASEAGLGALQAFLVTTPRVANFVTDFRIQMAWNNPLVVLDGIHDGTPNALVQRLTSPYELSQIIDLTPRIETFEILNFQFVPLYTKPTPRFTTRTLRRLRLVAPQEPASGYRHLPQFLSCFKSITLLSLEQLSSPVTPDLPAPPPRPAVFHLEMTFAHAKCCSDWLDLVCAGLDTSSTTTLTLVRLHEDRDPNEPTMLPFAMHRLIRRCPTLRSLIHLPIYFPRSLVTYPSRLRTLSKLELAHTLLYGIREMWAFVMDWTELSSIMRSPLASSVRELVLNISFTVITHEVLPVLPTPTESELQQAFRRAMSGGNWGEFGDSIRQVRSVTMVLTQERRLSAAQAQSRWNMDMEPLWQPVGEAYRRILEQVASERLRMSPGQMLQVVTSAPIL